MSEVEVVGSCSVTIWVMVGGEHSQNSYGASSSSVSLRSAKNLVSAMCCLSEIELGYFCLTHCFILPFYYIRTSYIT